MPANAGRGRTMRRGAGEAMPQDVSAQKSWGPARHVVDPVSAKLPTRRVTINLDEDLVAIFKAEALRGGPPYQVAINQALRAYLHGREMSEQNRAVEVVLTALDDEAVRRKLRSIR
jgi:uncharacterized protein (DUF4415 family)